MSQHLSLWVYLASTPLFWLTLTLVVWGAADRLALASKRNPLVNPVLVSVVAISVVLVLTGTPYEQYFSGAQFLHFLLGPAIVAIGVPLYVDRTLVKSNLVPLLSALLVGAVVAVVSVLLIGRALGLPHDILLALAPKSVTAGVAMGIAEQVGALPGLTAVMVILTGITGAVIVTPMMDALRITDYAARGFSVGLASHGIGTARAFVVNPLAGIFAGIAMGLNAVVSSLLVPALVWLVP
jgi:predicted murein hydrolase (TIGR00659 family)